MKEIGGYFSLELKNEDQMLPAIQGVLLNTGRNSLEYVLRSLDRITKVYLPYFTCDSVLEPFEKMNIQYEFYHINMNLEIKESISLQNNEYLIYTNYFGVKDKYIESLVNQYGEFLIVDNSQALYASPTSKCIYSPRKFIGIPDGGVAFTNGSQKIEKIEQSKSYDICSHLLKRIDCSGSEGYADFRNNSKRLSHQPILRMSNLTQRLLCSIDFENIAKIRNRNFLYLHDHLTHINVYKDIDIEGSSCPMVYPLYVEDDTLRSKLIANKVYVATYWPNVFEWCKEDTVEYRLAKYIHPLPIDQRYDLEDMDFIIRIING